jgi:hypothetical protein
VTVKIKYFNIFLLEEGKGFLNLISSFITDPSLYSRESDFIHNTVPYRTVPYRTVPYRTVPYRTVPYRTVPYRTVLYRTVLYRTVPYRFPLQFLSRSRSLSARRTVFFCLKFTVFPLKKSKARTVPYLKLRPFERFDLFISKARTVPRLS